MIVFREKLKGDLKRIIKDPTVFKDPLTVFNDIPYREDILEQVAVYIKSFVKAGTKFSVLFLGLTGTGKTFVAKFVMREIEKVKKEDRDYTSVVQAYVNCKEMGGNKGAVLHSLATQISKRDIPRRGLGTADYIKFMKDYMKNKKAIMYLDEIDALVKKKDGDDVLYQLLRVDAPLSVIMISNDLNVREGMDPRVLSSLGPTILFNPYDAQQLSNILVRYAKAGLNVWDMEIINYIAAIAASEHGDARKAVELLFRAAMVASREGSDKIEKRHVDIAYQEYEREKVVEAVKDLPVHYKLVLMSVLKDNIAVNSYQIYKQIAEEMGVRVISYRRYAEILNELEMFGLLKIRVENFGRRGGIKKIVDVIDREKLEKIISSSVFME
ncbi:MAG: AAA family ATPase [Sulfolobaceae archaeon]